MFSKGIESLLSQDKQIDIIHPDDHPNLCLEECLNLTHPDVVILNCDDSDPEISSAALCILRGQMGFSVIGLSLQNNQLSVHHAEQKQVRQVEDLLEAIRGSAI